jgi:nicotinamidase-related amidase
MPGATGAGGRVIAAAGTAGGRRHRLRDAGRQHVDVVAGGCSCASDIKIENHAQDRFYNTDLDKALKAKGITTLVLTGWKISGSVTYTSVGATLRGYTVVVPVDATSDATDYEIVIGKHQILNQNSANAANEPLKPRASTLSRTDLITFK